jgi:hypothetical protein
MSFKNYALITENAGVAISRLLNKCNKFTYISMISHLVYVKMKWVDSRKILQFFSVQR